MAEAAYDKKKPELKYLDFVHVAAVQAVLCVASLYELAKEKAGPLKGGVQSVETTVQSIVDPVYKRFHDLPLSLLCWADAKIDYVLGGVDHLVPATIKTLTFNVYMALLGMTEVLFQFLSDTRRSGIFSALKAANDRYEPMAVELYKEYEPIAGQYAVTTWQYLNGLPFFPQFAQLVIPTAAHCAEKYNHVVKSAAARGLVAAQYLPEVPIDKIAKVFSDNSVVRESGTGTKPEADAGEGSSATDAKAAVASPEAGTASSEAEPASTEAANRSNE